MYFTTFNLVIMYHVMLTEFRRSGNWGCNVPVHPELSLHKSQPNRYHANMYNLNTTSKLLY